MGSLLEFQRSLRKESEVVYSIETSELNPKKLEADEIEETVEIFQKEDYTVKTLRDYIYGKSTILAETGNVIKGVNTGEQIKLVILKVK